MYWSWNNWVLIFIPIAWFVQNCIHELSHMIIARITEGRRMLRFWPYPHCFQGRFYFARYESGRPKRIDRLGIRYIAPFYFGLIWAWLSMIVCIIIPVDFRIFCLPFFLAGFVDAMFFWYTYFFGSELSDGKLYRLVGKIRKGRKENG